MKLSERLFDGTRAENELEELLWEMDVKFENLGWDWYDNSLELYDVPADYRLPKNVRDALATAGFSVCYVNHVDKWETHYRLDEDKAGWRVSYPHKRQDDDKAIWVEEEISWQNTHNTKIKPRE